MAEASTSPDGSSRTAAPDIQQPRGPAQAESERGDLHDDGARFARAILDGAFERIYDTDGTYRLRPVAGEPPPPGRSGNGLTSPADAAASGPMGAEGETSWRRSGYCAALRDVSRWVAAVALKPSLDVRTLAALNAEIDRLCGVATRAT